MTHHLTGEEPEPCDTVPAGLLLVPVRPGPAGEVLRLFRSPLGERTAVGFTDRRRLAAVLGPEQPAVVLAEAALRAVADELGLARLTIDPQLAAAPVARSGRSCARPQGEPGRRAMTPTSVRAA